MKQSNSNKDSKFIFKMALFVVLFLALSVATVAIIRQTIKFSNYSERKELLKRLTESSKEDVTSEIIYARKVADIITNDSYKDLNDYENLDEYMLTFNSNTAFAGINIFFVDVNGKYYSSDGKNGKISDMEYYSEESADKVSYISNLPHLDINKTYIVFRNRFDSPVTIEAQNGQTDLAYCGMLYDISDIDSTVSNSFGGIRNSFIYDNTSGLMLYKNFGLGLLIDGYNIYPKFEKCVMKFGEEADDCITKCKNEETFVVSIEIDNQEYYFCSASLELYDWSIAYIIPASELNEFSGQGFGIVIFIIGMITLLLGSAAVMLMVSFFRNKISNEALDRITKLNNDLEIASKAKSDFLSNMSHDIRTPINGIMGMTTIAMGVEENPEKTMNCLKKINQASNHLLSLINDVLDMTRIEQGKEEITLKPISLKTVLDNVISIIQGQMTNRKLELISEINLQHQNVMCDDLHLRQILINILGNAVKFTPDGGTIYLRCCENSATDTSVNMSFEIEDNGVGMSDEFIDKIFDAFTQDKVGARSEYKGTGLGMAITKNLTELMGGTIKVESRQGEGSKFTLDIPFEIAADVSQPEILHLENADIKGVKILLVEDNELNMEVATELLGDAGAVITQATDGRQAVDIFSSHPAGTFDIILMDVMLPVMNGLEATRTIRGLQRPDARLIPIIAMTANAFDSDIRATLDAGMNAHLSKPFNITEVIKTIDWYVKEEKL